MFLNYIDLICTPKLVIVFSIHFFYRALQKFEYVFIYCSFIMAQIGTKFWYVFKPHTSNLHTKVSHRFQHIFFYRVLQKFQYIKIYCVFNHTFQMRRDYTIRLYVYIYNVCSPIYIYIYIYIYILISRISTKF